MEVTASLGNGWSPLLEDLLMSCRMMSGGMTGLTGGVIWSVEAPTLDRSMLLVERLCIGLDPGLRDEAIELVSVYR